MPLPPFFPSFFGLCTFSFGGQRYFFVCAASPIFSKIYGPQKLLSVHVPAGKAEFFTARTFFLRKIPEDCGPHTLLLLLLWLSLLLLLPNSQHPRDTSLKPLSANATGEREEREIKRDNVVFLCGEREKKRGGIKKRQVIMKKRENEDFLCSVSAFLKFFISASKHTICIENLKQRYKEMQ